MRNKSHRKDRQLCAEVAKATQWALGEREEEALFGAYVVSVEPAPTVGRLCIRVSIEKRSLLDEANTACASMLPEVRREVAEAIQRKKTPELFFVIEPRVSASDVP